MVLGLRASNTTVFVCELWWEKGCYLIVFWHKLPPTHFDLKKFKFILGEDLSLNSQISGVYWISTYRRKLIRFNRKIQTNLHNFESILIPLPPTQTDIKYSSSWVNIYYYIEIT